MTVLTDFLQQCGMSAEQAMRVAEHLRKRGLLNPKRVLSRDELLAELQSLSQPGDIEVQHALADQALLDYINDSEITKAFDAIPKWYA
jgi:hypothetical protein